MNDLPTRPAARVRDLRLRFLLLAVFSILLLLFVAGAAAAVDPSPTPGDTSGATPTDTSGATPSPSPTFIPLPSGLIGPTPSPSAPGLPGPPAPTPITHPGDDSTNSCYDCHKSVNAKQAAITDAWQASVHGKAGVGCADCHGGDPRSDQVTVAMSKDANFVGVPGRSQTVGICGSCHSDPNRMRQYNLSTDQYSKYWTSVHGQRLLAANDTRVAICIDCHGTHDIKKASDPTAPVYPFNVPKTCASCHSDATLMQPYGIPTNQYDTYKKSIHGNALLVEQNINAPSCASCHGSHDAKPPSDSEVVDVCGKCHTATEALYEQSRHSLVPAVAPKCVTCHGTHDVAATGEFMFLHATPPKFECSTCHAPGTQTLTLAPARFKDPADRRCDTCHHPDSLIYSQVQAIYNTLDSATAAYAAAEERIAQAAELGMIVTDADVSLTEAKTNLIQARAAVHTTKLTTVAGFTDQAVSKAGSAETLANAKLDESVFRREAMLVIILLIAINVIALYFIKRRLDRALPE
jgi:hypothetical protein